MASYYDFNKATSANQRCFILNDSEEQHFPFEGLYIGSLSGGELELPALVDICEVKAFCMLYNRIPALKSITCWKNWLGE